MTPDNTRALVDEAREWQTMFDQFMLGQGADPGPLYPFIARAICVAYTEGKLTK